MEQPTRRRTRAQGASPTGHKMLEDVKRTRKPSASKSSSSGMQEASVAAPVANDVNPSILVPLREASVAAPVANDADRSLLVSLRDAFERALSDAEFSKLCANLTDTIKSMTDNGFPALRAEYIAGFGMAAGPPPPERQPSPKRRADENAKMATPPSKKARCDGNETTLIDNSQSRETITSTPSTPVIGTSVTPVNSQSETITSTPSTPSSPVVGTPVAAINTPVAAANAPVAAVNSRLETITSTPSTPVVGTPIAAINTPVAAANAPVAAINTPVAAVNSPVAAVNSPVAAVNTRVVGNPVVSTPMAVSTPKRKAEEAVEPPRAKMARNNAGNEPIIVTQAMIDYERRVDEDMLAERNRKKIEHGSKPYYRRTPPEQLEAMYRERAWHRAQNEARNVRAKAKKAAIEAAKKEEAIAFRLYMMNERKRAAAEADLPAQVAKKVCFDLTERKTSAAVANLCTDTTDIAAEPVPAFIPTTSQGGRIYGFDHDQWALHDELGLDDEGALLTAAQKARYVAHLKQVEDKMRKKASDATSSTRHGTEAPSDPSPIVQGRDRGDKSPSSTRPGTYALNYDDFSSDSESDDESQPINNVASNLQMGTAVGRTLAENNNTTSSSTDKRLARATESKQYSSATNGGSYTPAAKQIEVPDSVSPHITPFIRKPPTRLPVARPYTQLHPLANEIGRDIAANKSNAPSQQISADNSLRQNAGAKDITTHSHRIIEATSTTKDKAASSEPVKAAAMQTVVGQDGLSQSASGRKAAINFNKRPKATTKQTSVGNDKTENYGDTVQSRLGHDITNNVFAAMLDEAGIANPIDGADLLTPSAVAVTGYNPARNNYGHDIPDGVFAAMLEEAGIADVLKRADSSAVYSRGSYGPGPLADSANGDMGLMLKESGIEVEL